MSQGYRTVRNTMGLRHIIAFMPAIAAFSYPAFPAVDFARDIQPILEKRCYECHGEKKQKSGVRFDRKSAVFNPGDSGKPAVVPGNSADSLLLQRLVTKNDDEV